ncbi:hypothetical protein Rhopal_006473-T1 [Rhodotorula paludigena]|uniref:Eukaryotic translation initiation factor 3 subunit K n=1 Tax=Rhodotorula paludigena TaxID=86838 RepID=A0AAV5GT63_9BASI|nr:hypothetical protein Rhopal_006473-T1 [Rhodotorula paludigena]
MLAQADRPAHIQTLISGVDRYNPSNVHLLEDYLQQQLANDHQFNPAILSPSASLSILFQTLSHAPFAPDFSLAWSLLSDSFVTGAALPPALPDSDDDDDEPAKPAEPHGEKETAQRLAKLSALLHARQFRAFWQLARAGDEDQKASEGVAALRKGAKGWDARVQKSIADEVERSFGSVRRETVEVFLGIEDKAQLEALAKERQWTVREQDVQIPQNESNTPKASVTHERMEIEQLARLLGRSQA